MSRAHWNRLTQIDCNKLGNASLSLIICRQGASHQLIYAVIFSLKMSHPEVVGDRHSTSGWPISLTASCWQGKKKSVQSPGKPRFFLVVRKFPYFYCSATEPRRLPAGFIVLCLFAEPSGYSYPGKPSVMHDNDLGLLHNWGKAKWLTPAQTWTRVAPLTTCFYSSGATQRQHIRVGLVSNV